LAAGGVGGIRGGRDGQRAADAGLLQLPEGVGEPRVPVAVASVDRQVDDEPQCGDQLAIGR